PSTIPTMKSKPSSPPSARSASCSAELQFRHATPADIDAIVALVTSAYRGEASRAGWTTEADLLDGARIDPEVLRQDIERPQSIVLMAEAGDGDERLRACAHVAVEDGAGYFGMFAVRPGLQGGRVGSAVLAECDRIAREDWGPPSVRIAA